MSLHASRRDLILAALSAPLLHACHGTQHLLPPLRGHQHQAMLEHVDHFLAQLEIQSHGRLGVSAINTANQLRIDYHADQRFPLCSTYKLVAVAAVLAQSMRNLNLLQQRIQYSMQQVKEADYAPITVQHVDTGMTVSELCAACISYSDNAAGNLLVQLLGGPTAVTQFARRIGDQMFRLDRWEPGLNTALPNDERDTSTPAAMANTLQQLLVGHILAPTQRDLLVYWLKNNTTGNARIRAGIPANWIVGDKTGTGAYGSTHDIGIVWPPQQAPIIMAIYFTHPEQTAKPHDALIASVSRIISQALSTTHKNAGQASAGH